MSKKFLAQTLSFFLVICLFNASVLVGMESNKQEQNKSIEVPSPSLLDLPDEILANIVIFMFDDDHCKAILTMSLVNKRFNESVVKNIIYKKFFPGLLHQKHRKTVPQQSF